MKLYQHIATLVQARDNCLANHNTHWFGEHTESLVRLGKERLPSGSGFDNGTTVDLEQSRPQRLVLQTAFHHMDENGSYDGWEDYTVVVTPDLASGFDLHVYGVNRNDIKEYIGDVFHNALSEEGEIEKLPA